MPKEKWKKIANEYVISLFPVFTLVDAFCIGIEKIIGKPCYICFKIENNDVVHYSLPKNWEGVHKALVDEIKKNRDFLKNVYFQIDKIGNEQIAYTEEIRKNLSEKNNQDLNNFYQKYIEYNAELYSYGLVLPLLDFHTTTFLSDELNKILKNKKAEKYFDILTIPVIDTYNKKQELNLLKILLEIKKYKKLFSKFKSLNSFELIDYIKKNNDKIWKLIKNHTKKYCWVHYVYEGPAASENYFIDIIKDFVIRNIDPEEELLKHKQNKIKVKSEQDEILKNIEADKYQEQIIKLARDAVFYKAYRRELQSWSYYNMEFVLREIARRTNLSLKQVRMMLPEDIEKALLQDEVDIKKINQRIKMVIYGRSPERFCLTGDEAIDFFKRNVCKERRVSGVDEFFGAVSYKGKSRGAVKLINSPKDIGKMNRGDILVATATNPNLMPAIRLAGAMITDEGGLTCHAAIVSRELKIPCVVGTKVATKILKDGDVVEVDADNGIVKIIKK